MSNIIKSGFSLIIILSLTLGMLSLPSISHAAYTGYSWRASLTIPASWIDADLTNFPILFTQANLPATIFDEANADGGDIRFSSDEDGDVPLNREIVSFDNVGDTAEIWVKVPALDDTVDTVIYVWYGHATNTEPAADDADEGSEGVWDANFKAVYHMAATASDNPNHYTDSTSNANHMTGTSMAIAPSAGPWGSGYSAEFDGSADYLYMASLIVSDYPLTVSSWGFPDGQSDIAIASLGAAGSSLAINTLRLRNPVDNDVLAIVTGNKFANTTDQYSASTWAYFAGRFAGDASRFAILNTHQSAENTDSVDFSALFDATYIATQRQSGAFSLLFNGKLDEVRFSSTDRSAPWLKAEYNTGNAPGDITAGTPEDPAPDSTPPTVSVTAPSEGATVSGATVTISADADDDVGVAGVQFKLNTNTLLEAEDTSAPYSITWDSTAVSDGAHTVIAVARDAAGNYATSTAINITVDNTDPTAGTVAFPSITSTTITASSTGDSDANGLAASPYQYRNTTSDTYSGLQAESYQFTGLTPNTEYTFTVGVQDLAGNYATSSSAATTTRAALPTSLVLTTISQTQIDSSWDANNNPDGTEYYAENVEASDNSGWITDTEWSSTSLTCGTTYTIRVKARNADNVETAFTGTSQATSACDVPVAEEEEEDSGGGGSISGGYYPAITNPQPAPPPPIPPTQVPYINPVPVVSTPQPAPFTQLPTEVQTASEQEALSPLATRLTTWLERFPSLANTFLQTGIDLTNPATLTRLKGTKFTLPLPLRQAGGFNLANLPSNTILAQGPGNIGLNLTLAIDDEDQLHPTITTLANQALTLSIKPDHPANIDSIDGYLVLKQIALEEQPTKTSSLFPIAHAQETPANITNLPVLLEFAYTDPDNDGLYTASFQTPPVPGEYEVLTVIREKGEDPQILRLVTVIDPEGYVYRVENDGIEARLPNVTVSLYWLNPVYDKFELWPAAEYSQDNPQITEKDGRYSFLVPEGTYYLQTESAEYHPYQSANFTVTRGSGVHQNIELKPIKSLTDWLFSPIIWLTLIVVLGLGLIYRKYVAR